MGHVVTDLDGTISSSPYQMGELLMALKSSGHRVTVLTGTSSFPVTQQDFDEKVGFLTSLGCSSCWDDMTILGGPLDGLAKAKSKWLSDHHVGIFLDNNLDNAKAASKVVPLVLVPWASRTK